MKKSRTIRFFGDDGNLIVEERNAMGESVSGQRRQWITERVELTPTEQAALLDIEALKERLEMACKGSCDRSNDWHTEKCSSAHDAMALLRDTRRKE